jgi:hypothetical protein
MLLCLIFGFVIAAGPANTPVTVRAVNDVDPMAAGRMPNGPFTTTDDPPETVWTKAVTMTYTTGVTPVQDTLMWVAAGQSEESIYVYKLNDPSRPLVDAFPQTEGPTGWGIRDMAWKASTDEVFAGFDNQTYHVYNASTHEPNHTYTVSGYSGTVRGFGYDPAQDSCWTCNFSNSPMAKFSITGANGQEVKPAAEMMYSYGIAWSPLQNCFWVTQAGSPGASPIYKLDQSYAWVDSFNPAGWDLGGGCEMWRDTFLLAVEQGTTDAVWCFKFSIAPPPAHDVGVSGIVAPTSSINPGPVTPEAKVKNFGGNPESSILVTCWIDSGATRVYTANATLPGPLEPGIEANVTFTPDWNPGPARAHYTVTMFTVLGGDENAHNDTAAGTTTVSGPVFADTIHVRRLGYFAPTIDGNITSEEWAASIMYDISDLAGRGGAPRPAGSCIAYYLYDSVEGFVYYAVDFPNHSSRVDYDQFGPFMDENRDDRWSTDSSEGNHWVEFVAPNTDEVIYRAVLDTLANAVWEMGVTPGAVSASSLTSGHLQFEAKIPIGAGKWQYSVNPGDTVGSWQYAALDSGATFAGWWPQTVTGMRWANPRYYGTMIFDPDVTGVDDQTPRTPYALYKARPSLIRDCARISYYVGRQAHVELGVYDATGSLVKTLASGAVLPGERTATWNRTDNRGNRVPNGTYFYRLSVDGESVSGKAVVLQ